MLLITKKNKNNHNKLHLLFADKEAKVAYYEEKRENKIKKQIVIFALFAVISLFTIVGVTYAWLTTTVNGTKTNSIVAGTFKIDFTDGNTINLTNSEPLSNTAGMATTSYDFSVTNSGNVKAKYQISLEENSSTIDKKYIMYSIKEGSGSWSSPASLENGLNLLNNIAIDMGVTNTYSLKMWLSEDAPNSEQNKSFEARIVVSAIQSNFANYVDITPPTIKLNGEVDNTITKSNSFTDLGVESVTDDKDTLDKSNVKVTYEYYDGTNITTVTAVDTTKIGVYYIYYKIDDSTGNTGTRIRTVSVVDKDTNAPTITLTGDSIINVYKDGTYTELGASATDTEDGTLDVITIGTVNTHIVGSYTIKYLAIDKAGNTVSTTRIVNVLTTGKIILTPAVSDTYAKTSTITINATSTAGKITGYAVTTSTAEPTTWTTTDSQSITEEVMENTNGIYYIHVKDSLGNTTYKKVTVTKIDIITPVCTFTKDTTYVSKDASSSLTLNCTDTLSGLPSQTLTTSNFTLSSENISLTSVVGPTSITNGYKYVLTVKGVSVSTNTISLKAGTLSDNAGNTNELVGTNIIVTSMNLNTTTLDLDLNGTSTGTITATGDNLGTISYTSNDTSIATVDSNGNVTGLSIGDTTITVNSTNGGSQTVTVKVTKTLTATYVKQGTGVSTIGKTTDSCKLTSSNKISCTVTSPSITVNSNFTAVGWNTNKDATTGTAVGELLTLTDNATYYSISYKKAIVYNITYTKQGTGVTAIGKTTDSCTIAPAYNNNTQATSCIVIAPTISVSAGYTALGWNTNKDATAGIAANSNITLSSDATYYSISKKDAITLNALWNANGATLSSSATSSCTLTEAYNGTSQATSCTVKAPTITGSANTPNVIGFNNSAADTTSILGSGATLTLTTSNTNKTWYAITNNDPITYTATYTKQGIGVTGISSTGNSCTIASSYNGAVQGTSCTVTSPSISVNAGYTAVGWALDSNASSALAIPGGTLTLSNNNTYYSISYKNEIVLTAKWNANGNTLSTTTDSSCTLGKAYNNNTQATTCNVSAPTITAASATPTIIGFNTTSTATTNSSDYVYATKQLNLTETNSGKTWYAITSAEAKTYTITFNKNGAVSQTNSSGDSVTDASVTRSCTIDATYNGAVQATTCKVTSPTITASTNTPNVVGYNTTSSATTSSWDETTEKAISASATYYAITSKGSKTYTATYTKQGTGVTAIGATSNSCTIAATYNGAAQATTCSVTLPTITVSAGYTAVGWNTSSTATTGTAVSTSVALAANTTYYSISYKDSLTYTAHFNANNATLSDASDKSCVIAKAYNSDTQATSCTVTAPTITAPSATPTVVGFNTTSSATTSTLANGGTLTLTSANNGDTWYAITKNSALTYTANYTKQGLGVTAIGSTANSCTIAATYNGTNQATSCIVIAPTISVSAGYTALGWNTNKDATSGIAANSNITLSSDATYYSISKKDAITLNALWNANGATLSSSATSSCTLTEAYNGTSQATSCTVKAPTITGSANTPNVIGFNNSAADTTSILGSGATLTLTTSNTNKTWYAITNNDPITYTATYTKQGIGVTGISSTGNSCTIASSYNGEVQGTSCTVTSPSISVNAGYTAVGWALDSNASSALAIPGGTLTLSNNNTYYSISYKNEIVLTAKWNANGNTLSTTTDSSCTLGKAYNNNTQATTCNVSAPTITAASATPTIIGFNTTSTATTNSSDYVYATKQLNLTETNSGKTWYAITSAEAKTYTITFNKNGAVSQTNSSGDSVTDASVTRSCTIDATYNGAVQATTCKVTSPTITASTNTPNVVGYNTTSSATTSSWDETTEKAISASATYYAITSKGSKTYTATYTKQGTGVTAIGATSNSCTIAATYNGAAQATTCSVTLPTITVSAGYTAVGWNTSSTATTGTAVSTSVALAANTTYYSISYKDSLTYTAHFNANNATLSDASDKSCVIAKAYNSDTQATSCTITAPTITAPSATPTVVGFNTTSSATTSTLANGGTLTLTSANNDSTWYAITKKDALSYSVTYAKGSNVSAIGKTSDSCTIAATYNGTSQATSCNVTTPSITANSGYNAIGWSLTSGATTGVSAGSALTLTSSNDGKTYYGNASANDYTISYYSEGLSIGTTAAKYGTSFNLTMASTLGATKTGYTFKGWDTASAATTIVYTDNESVSNLAHSGTVNLYAVYVDDIAPVCSWSSASPTTTGNTTTLTLSCTDLGIGIPSTTLTTSNFTTSNATYGSITSVSAPTAITNGYSYVVTVTGNAVGTFQVSLNANSIADNNSNKNALTTSSNITVNGRTYTATFTKNGSGVNAIGSTSLSCTTTGSNTTCSVSAPAITVSAGYTAVGWNTTSDATTGLAELSMSANTTYYSISYKNEITYTTTFNLNNAGTQTNESGTAVATNVTRSCTIARAYNSNTQATTCSITSPTLTGSTNTPTVVGYNTSSSATTSSWNQTTAESVSSDLTYYAITSALAKTYTAHWNANGATLSSSSDTSCTIAATYNGTSQATSCSVTAPTITSSLALGFNTTSTAITSILGSGATLTLTSSNNGITYYAITAKTATTGSCASLTYNGTSQTLASGGTGVTYSNNTMTNAGTQTVTITANSGYRFSDNTTSKTLSCSIAQKAVSYTANSQSKVYDGTALTNSDVTLSSGSLISGHTATFTTSGSITNAGSTTNTLSSVTITDATSNDVTANYAITKNNGTLTITKATPTLTLSATSGSVNAGSTTTFTEKGSVAGSFGNVSGTTTVATVSPVSYASIAADTTKTVTITGVSNGTSTITVTFTPTDTTNYNSKTATYTVTGYQVATTGSCASLTYNGSAQTLASGGTGVTYSNNTMTNAGTQTVTVNATSGYRFSDNTTSKTLSCSISKATPTLTLSATSGSVNAGSTTTFTEKGSVAGSFGNTSGTTSVASVSPASYSSIAANTAETVTITGVSNGTSTITVTFTPTDTTNYNSKTATYTVTGYNVATTGNCSSLTYNGSAQTLASGGTGVTYTNNTLTNAGSQTVTITANIGYRFSDNTTSKTLSCSISKATPTLTLSATSGSVNVGSTTTFTEKGSVAGSFGNVSGTTTVATVSPASYSSIAANTAETVTITGVSNGTSTITVTFTPTDTTNYNSKTATYTVTGYNVATTGSCASLTYNGSAQTLASGGTGVTYSNNTMTNAGTQTVTVNATSGYRFSDNTTSKTLSCSISKATPTLTLSATSGSVNAGSTTTFTEKGSVAGSFGNVSGTTTVATVSPASYSSIAANTAETVTITGVSNGTSTITVTFTPTDTTNYNSKTATYTVTGYNVATTGSCASLIYTGSAQTLASGGTGVTYTNNTLTNAGSQTVTITANSGYRFSDNTTSKTLSCSIAKKAVGYTAVSGSKVYDGTALTNNNATLSSGSLVLGHSASFSVTGSITNVGSTTNTLSSVTITDASSNDVTANYNITKNNGTLTITKATPTLTLSATSGSVNAGSTTTFTEKGSVAGSFGNVSGTTSIASVSPASYSSIAANTAETVTITGVSNGTSTITVTFTPTDTTNYNSKTATYTVTGYNVATTGSCASLTYNGSAQTLASGGTGVTYTNNTLTNAGSQTVTITADSGYRFSDNTTSKTLSCSIAKKAVGYTAVSGSKVYDGTALTNNNATLSSGSLVLGHSASFSVTGSITNVGSTTNTLSSVTITDASSNDVTANYNITKNNGTLTITKATPTLTLSATSGSVNAGSTTTFTEKGSVAGSFGNVSGTTTVATVSPASYSSIAANTAETVTITGVSNGTSTITVTFTPTDTTNYNSKTATYTVTGYNVATTGSCASLTYNGASQTLASGGTGVTYTNNTLTNAGTQTVTITANSGYRFSDNTTSKILSCSIAKKAVGYTIGSTSKVYDGSALTNNTITLTSGSLVTGHTASFVTSGSITNVGSTTNTLSSVTITDASSNDVTANYDITKNNGTLTITKATPTLTLSATSGSVNAGATTTFTEKSSVAGTFSNTSGTPSVATNSPSTYAGVAANTAETVTITGVSNGTSTITVTFTPTDTTNYNSKTATYTVTGYNVATTGNCASLTYDGASQTLASGGTGVTYTNNTLTNAGSQTVTITANSGYRFSDNTTSKTLSCSIAKKAVGYTAVSGSKVYDGTALTNNNATLSSGSLVSGHSASFSITGSITNVGSTTNTLSSVTITDASSNDVTANYDITKNNGTLTITKATPTLTLSATSGSVNAGSTTTFTEKGSVAGSFGNVSGTTTVATVSPASYSSIAANTAETVTITGVSNGTSTITVTFTPTDTTNYNSKTATYTVTGYNVATTGNCSSLTYNGSAQTLASGGTGVTYTNNTLTNAGSQTVTITANSGYRFSDNTTSKTLSCSISKATPTLTLSATSGSVNAGSTTTFTEKGSVAGSFGNVSGTTTVATVSPASYSSIAANTAETVTITGVSNGTSTITVTFTPTDTTNYNSKTATYTVTGYNVATTGSCASLTYNGSAQTLASGGMGVTYTNNTLTNAESQTVTITANSGYRFSDNTTSKTLSCSIDKKAVSYAAGSSSKIYDGTALTNTNATLTSGSLVSGHTATFTTSGSITNVGSTTNTLSSVTITDASSNDVTANYNITKVNGTLTITKATPTLTLSATSGSVNAGSTTTFTEKGSVAGSFGNVSGTATVATVSPASYSSIAANTAETVTVTGIRNGTSTITVTFTPTDTTNYNSTTATYTISSIDTTAPVWSLESVVTSNSSTNVTSAETVTITFKGSDNSGTINSTLVASNITVLIAGFSVSPTKSLTDNGSGEYELVLSGLSGNGALTINIAASTLTDLSGNANVATTITPSLMVGHYITINSYDYGTTTVKNSTRNITVTISPRNSVSGGYSSQNLFAVSGDAIAVTLTAGGSQYTPYKVIYNGTTYSSSYVNLSDVGSAQTLSTYFIFASKKYNLRSDTISTEYIDADTGGSTNGANVQLWASTGYSSQWTIDLISFDSSTGIGWFRLMNANNGGAMDVTGGATTAGTNVETYTYNGSDAQLWKLIPTGDGSSVVIYGKGSGKVLDAAANGTANGTNIAIHTYNDTTAQKWIPVVNTETVVIATCSEANYTLCPSATESNGGTYIHPDANSSSQFTPEAVCTGGTFYKFGESGNWYHVVAIGGVSNGYGNKTGWIYAPCFGGSC